MRVDVDGVGCRGRVALELRRHAQGPLPARLGGGLVGHAVALGVGVADFFAVVHADAVLGLADLHPAVPAI